MNPHCTHPELQAALLEDARDGRTMAPDRACHIEKCAACQSATERLRRMVAVWTADQLEDDVIAAAEVRFHARRKVTRTTAVWFDVVPFASAGVIAGFLLLAATGTIRQPWHSRQAQPSPPNASAPASTVVAASDVPNHDTPRFAPVYASTEESAKWVRARPHIQTPRGVASLVDGLRLELKKGESLRVSLSGGQTSSVEGPCLVEFWSTPTEVGGWKIIRDDGPGTGNFAEPTPPAASGAGAPPPVPSGASSSNEGARAAPSIKKNGSREGGAAAALNETVTRHAGGIGTQGTDLRSVRAWARAAVALREDDFNAADSAFDELGRAGAPATRDAARLARAQLWISRGREAAVRPVLEQLARTGATALVRQRASELLDR
jgi:hypothetical protein